jgi:hypothetical protein
MLPGILRALGLVPVSIGVRCRVAGDAALQMQECLHVPSYTEGFVESEDRQATLLS